MTKTAPGRRALLLALAGLLPAGPATAQPWQPPPIPPPRYERRPPPPGRGLAWQPGFWRWDGRGYAWIPGQWVRVRGPRGRWDKPGWHRGRDGWRWSEGGWR